MAAAYLKNRTPHKALKMGTPLRMLHSTKLDAATWEGKVCGYSEENKYYRVWNPNTRRGVESRSVTLIETPLHLPSPPSKLSPLQDMVLPSGDLDDDTLDKDYISHDDLLRDVRDHTGVLDFNANIPANHENVSGLSADPQVQQVVDQIRDFTKRDLLTPTAPLPRAASPAKPLTGAIREPLSREASPPSRGGASPKTGRHSPASVPATARKGAAMRNNRIHRPNVVTWN